MDCQRKNKNKTVYLFIGESRDSVLNSIVWNQYKYILKRWHIWCEIFCSVSVWQNRKRKPPWMKCLEAKQRSNFRSAPGIHPKYDAVDQPTLILQSNCMKTEKAKGLRHQSPGSLSLRVITETVEQHHPSSFTLTINSKYWCCFLPTWN